MKNMSRRAFIKLSFFGSVALAGCGGGGSSGNDDKPTTEPTSNAEVNPNIDKPKALVYLMLNGGNDSFNTLIPTDTSSYNEYATTRSNLKIAKNSLLELNFTDKNNKTFGLHPTLKHTQKLFNDKKLAFIANSGVLVEKITKAEFKSGSKPVPLGLMSHSDQRMHWQSMSPNKRSNIGIFGKFADRFQGGLSGISMNISVDGTNILQNGVKSHEYSITKNGSVGLKVKESSNNAQVSQLNNALLDGFNEILKKSYSDDFEKTYMDTVVNAQSNYEKYSSATNGVNISHKFTNYDNRTDIEFSARDKDIPKQFEMIAKSIKSSQSLSLNKQTFYIDYYGWDHHDELLNNHKRMLEVVDNALYDFQTALEELGISDKVVTVVVSDFGRTLTSNGNGTDHAWGGNVMVLGDDIDGGKVYGEYPSLKLDSDLDIGGGVLIPTTSSDEIFAELAYWFGIEKKDFKTYLPNIENFYALDSTTLPIGFLK